MRRAITVVLLSLTVTAAGAADQAGLESLSRLAARAHEYVARAAIAQREVDQRHAALRQALSQFHASQLRLARAIDRRRAAVVAAGVSLEEYNATLSARASAGDRQAMTEEGAAAEAFEGAERAMAALGLIYDSAVGDEQLAVRRALHILFMSSPPAPPQLPGAGQP